MLELIATIILLIGIGGMSVIIFRKIPVLVELSPQKIKEPGALEKLRNKIKNNGAIKSLSGELLLQKTLSKIRVLTLKTENKTSSWLAKSRQRTIRNKNKFSDDYWKKLKERK